MPIEFTDLGKSCQLFVTRLRSRTERGNLSSLRNFAALTIGGLISLLLIISCGDPTSIWPSPLTKTIRSTKWITRSSLCSAMITVNPRSWTSLFMIASTSSAATGSRALVGSSRTKTFGFITNADPIATRCCSPPDSEDKLRFLIDCKESKSITSSTLRRIMVGSTPFVSKPKAISSST